ncbi:MAG TPA: NAD(P)-dependent oxidoreductase [Stellaceae bacterium]|nr:NAD(P)-dependent oxidoreductase [Stellaceae bacterium]
MKPRILLALPLPDDLAARLGQVCEIVRAPGGPFPTASDLAEIMPGMSGVISTVGARFDDALLARCPELRVISNCAVGLDNIDLGSATRRRVAVCNAPGVQDAAVAELALALVMALARNLVGNDAYVRSGRWERQKSAPLGQDIAGKRLGLLGMGGIGRCTARLATAIGMEVVYFKRGRDHAAEAAGIARFASRDELFATADFVSLHVPLTEETRGSVGAAAFARMKHGAFLINTARGAVVDEAALVEALRSGHLAGAGLDVMVDEPLPPSSPLCGLPSVILQPHAASATRETRRRMEETAVGNLLAVITGQRPPVIVNPEVFG